MLTLRPYLLAFLLLLIGCAPTSTIDSAPPAAETTVESFSPQPSVETTAETSTESAPANTDSRGGGQLAIFDSPAAERAKLLGDYADAIRDQPRKFGDVGSVLEALAVRGIKRIYPAPAHKVISGIEYADATGRTLGELDVVVFLTATGDALMISEVKLSKNLERAASKANSQLRRFRTAITEGRVARIQHKDKDGETYGVANFENVLRYGKIGSRGALEHGFDWEIDLTRDEGDQLQQILLQQPAAQP